LGLVGGVWVVLTAQRNIARIQHSSFHFGIAERCAIVFCTIDIAMLLAKSADRWLATIGLVVIGSGLIAIGIIDAFTHRVPRYINGLAITLGVPLLVLDAIIQWDLGNILRAGVGAVALFAFFIGLKSIAQGSFGKGDVLLAPLVGFALAHNSWGALVSGVVGIFLIGGVVSAALLFTGRVSRKSRIAFGPYIVVGTLLALVI
jgi:leader peptidase (prepilin peptidase)/N-methyltransferase